MWCECQSEYVIQNSLLLKMLLAKQDKSRKKPISYEELYFNLASKGSRIVLVFLICTYYLIALEISKRYSALR